MTDWGRVFVSTRLEKAVSAKFVQAWTALIQRGVRAGDGVYMTRGQVAHKAQNDIVRHFLRSECDTLLTLDSDADVTPDFLERFRSYEPGHAFDALQAFYCRRGWPPRAIWLKRNAAGEMMDHFVIDPDAVEDVDIVGTHACLIRRTVFETMLGDADPDTFEWFYYPRHASDSEDGAFSAEAQALGFRLGVTSAIRAGHIGEMTVDWQTYQDYIDVTGRRPLLERYQNLAQQVGAFTGESVHAVIAKAVRGNANVKEAWDKTTATRSAAEERKFYGDAGNGYLYDLLNWNCQPSYEHLLAPLRNLRAQRVLVVGAGLGTEADAMADHNEVHVYDLPGVLRDFCAARLGERARMLSGDTLPTSDVRRGYYDLIVAIDTLEHVHPRDLPSVLMTLHLALKPGGALYAHNNWHDQDIYPMHYDHRLIFDAWCASAGLKQEGQNLWRLHSSASRIITPDWVTIAPVSASA